MFAGETLVYPEHFGVKQLFTPKKIGALPQKPLTGKPLSCIIGTEFIQMGEPP
jgi:hypothetical protein